MKKLIIFLLSFTMFFVNVKANVYKDGMYLSRVSDLVNNYKYKDYSDIKYLEYSDWQDKCNVDLNIYEIDYKDFYLYKNINKIKDIIIYDYSDNIDFNKLEIYDNDLLITYEFINNEKEIKIILDAEIRLDNLNLKLNLDNIEDISFSIKFIDDSANIIGVNNITNNEFNHSDIVYSENLIHDDNLEYIDAIKRCRYREYLIYNYNLIEDIKKEDKNINQLISSNLSNTYENNDIKETNDIEDNTKTNIGYDIDTDIDKQEDEDTNNSNQNTTSDNTKNDNNKDILNDLNFNNKFINPLKVSNDKSIVKYLIIVVIALTIVYIFYYNKIKIIRRK